MAEWFSDEFQMLVLAGLCTICNIVNLVENFGSELLCPMTAKIQIIYLKCKATKEKLLFILIIQYW